MAPSSLSVKDSPHRRIPSSYWPPLLRSPRQGLDVRCATELKSLSPVPNANRTRECSACSRVVPQRNQSTYFSCWLSLSDSPLQEESLRRATISLFWAQKSQVGLSDRRYAFPSLTSFELEYHSSCRRATRRQSSCFVRSFRDLLFIRNGDTLFPA
jgi:hypothetical protein